MSVVNTFAVTFVSLKDYLLVIIETGSRVAKTGVSQENTVLYRRQVSKHSDSHMTLLKVDELFSAFFDIFSI